MQGICIEAIFHDAITIEKMSDATDKLIEFCFDGILIPINLSKGGSRGVSYIGSRLKANLNSHLFKKAFSLTTLY